MIWLKAIWVNIKSMLEDLLCAVAIIMIMLAITFAGGFVIFGVGSLINYLFGPNGVIFTVCTICAAFALVLISSIVQGVYMSVKRTKERLEREEAENDLLG